MSEERTHEVGEPPQENTTNLLEIILHNKLQLQYLTLAHDNKYDCGVYSPQNDVFYEFNEKTIENICVLLYDNY